MMKGKVEGARTNTYEGGLSICDIIKEMTINTSKMEAEDGGRSRAEKR